MTVLEGLIGSYGLLAVLLGTFFEGETILVLGGLAAHRGYLSLGSVIAVGFLGSFVGDQFYFQLGRWHGAALIAKRPAWHARVQRAQRVLERHHIAFILGFRFLYGLRTISPFAIGMSEVPIQRYLILNFLGGLVWSVAVAMLGYSVGGGAEALIGRVKEIELWLFAGVAAAGSAIWLIYRVRERRVSDG